MKTTTPTPIHTQPLTRNNVADCWMAVGHAFMCCAYDRNFDLLNAPACLLEIFSEPTEGTLQLTCEQETARAYPLFINEQGCPVILLDPAEELVLSLNHPVIHWRLSPLPS